MSRIIYKYPVDDTGVIVGGDNQKVVHVGLDPKIGHMIPCIWVELTYPLADRFSDSMPQQRVQYLIMGTGWTMEDDESYHVGSVVTPHGMVWHIYGKRL